MFYNTEDLLPVISFNVKASKEGPTKHNDFVTTWSNGAIPTEFGCCLRWYLRVRKSQ
jgi:serine protein kinase